MLRRLKAAPTVGLPSSVLTGNHHRKVLLRSSKASIHYVNHHHHHVFEMTQHNAEPFRHVLQSTTNTSSYTVRSLTTTFHSASQNHEEQKAVTTMSKQMTYEDEEGTMRLMDFPEGASLKYQEEWLDTDAIINNSSSSSKTECEKEQEQQLIIMSRIEKEIPLLIQDYLSVMSSSSSTTTSDNKDSISIASSFEGNRRQHHRHHDNTSLTARYQNELKWIRKRRMARVVVPLHTNQQEHMQEGIDNADKDDDLSYHIHDEDEDLTTPRKSYLVDSMQTTNNIRHMWPPMTSRQQHLLLQEDPRSKRELLLDSCLALLRAMAQRDWAVVDDQRLLLTDDDDDDDAQYSTHEESSKFDPADHSFFTNNIDVQEDYGDDNNSNNDDTSLDDDVDDDDELFWTLRQLKLGGITLGSMTDYNLVLSRIALASELNHDDILETLFDTLRQIKEASSAAAAARTSILPSSCAGISGDGPNATTYEILLLIMVKRLGALRSALDLVRRDMLQTPSSSSSSSSSPSSSSSSFSSSHLCTTATLDIAIQLCETRGDLNLARALWRIAQSKNAAHDAVAIDDDDLRNVDNDTSAKVRITNRVYHSMLNMFKAVDARDEAMETLRTSLQDNDREINNGLDRVFVNAINWPNRSRKGDLIDNLPVLVSILNLLDEDTLYKPDVSVLKQLLISVAKGAQQEDHTARWKVVQRIFKKILNTFPAFKVNQVVVGIGLEASEALLDPKLAVEMVTRMLDGEFGVNVHFDLWSNDFSSSTIRQPQTLYAAQHQQQSRKMLLSSKSILKAMDICVDCGDAPGARRILDCVETHYDAAQIPKAIRQRLFVSTLKVFATAGQGQVAEQLLSMMQSRDLEPTEKAIGAVIHGYVLTKSSEKARKLFNDLKSGLFGVDIVPGPTSYNAIILDYIQNNSWSDALEIHDEMKKNRVVPLESTYMGLLLSSFKEGGRRRTMQFIDDELIRTNARVNAEVCKMALRLVLPEIAKSTELNRAIRSAQLEEQREPSKGLPQAKISERRVAAWNEVLKQLVKLSDALFPDENIEGKSS